MFNEIYGIEKEPVKTNQIKHIFFSLFPVHYTPVYKIEFNFVLLTAFWTYPY